MENPIPVPAWRGRIHQAAFWASLPAGAVLVAVARTSATRLGNLIFAVSASALFAASATFHRLRARGRDRPWLQRLDHSMIYVLIAGTYTPFALMALEGRWRVAVLAVVWGGGVTGIILRLAFRGLDALKQVLYLGLGWMAVVTLPAIDGRLLPVDFVLLFAGGVLYTGGAILFGLKRPALRPEVFGYHELWHAMVVTAVLCHFGLILSLTLRV